MFYYFVTADHLARLIKQAADLNRLRAAAVCFVLLVSHAVVEIRLHMLGTKPFPVVVSVYFPCFVHSQLSMAYFVCLF